MPPTPASLPKAMDILVCVPGTQESEAAHVKLMELMMTLELLPLS